MDAFKNDMDQMKRDIAKLNKNVAKLKAKVVKLKQRNKPRSNDTARIRSVYRAQKYDSVCGAVLGHSNTGQYCHSIRPYFNDGGIRISAPDIRLNLLHFLMVNDMMNLIM
jgi:hypothetical protein